MYYTQIAVNLLQQQMKRGNREVYCDNWLEIKNHLASLSIESFRCEQSDQLLKSIVGSLLGAGKHKGLIEKRIPYYFKKAPSCWSQEVHQIVEMFSPRSELLRSSAGILRNKDYQIAIEFKILPKSVQSEFPTSQCRNSKMLKSLRRVSADQFVISMWQWLWIHVGNLLVNLPEIEESPSIQDEQTQDEMYYIISRHPLLLILRKALMIEYSETKGKQLRQRMRGVFELFIIEDLICFVKQSNRYPRNSYQLRSHHLAAMFLLICSRKDSLKGETLQIYYEFFQNATQGYSSISKQGSNNLRYLIRNWDFFITRKSGADYYVFKQLDKANPFSGWYKLQRCPIKLWLKQAKEPELLQYYEDRLITSIGNKIYRLLRNYDDWIPNFSFLFVLQQFVQLDKNTLSICLKKTRKEEDDRTVRRCFQRILTHLAENGANQKVLRQIQRQLNEQFLQIWDTLLNINFVEKVQTAKLHFFTSNRERNQEISLNYQSCRFRNVWQYQRQDNEFQSLLIASRWLASKLDKLIPGHEEREYPCINIRLFANPFIFLGFVFLVVLFLRSNLKE